MSLRVREATSESDLSAIRKLRYRVSFEEFARDSEGIDHEKREISDCFDSTAFHFVAESDGRIIGAVRYNANCRGPLPNEEWLGLKDFAPFRSDGLSTTDKLVVEHGYRSGMATGKLAIACYRKSREISVEFDFVLCRPHLVPLYQALGYHFYGPNFVHPKYGCIVSMALVIQDLAYLKTVRSPFYRIARSYQDSQEARTFFNNKFPKWNQIRPSSAKTESELWTEMGQQLFANAASQSPSIATGLAQEEVSSLLKRLTPLHFEPEQPIVSQGELGHGLFCLIEGEAAVERADTASTISVITALRSGDLFGEMNFFGTSPRSATVRAKTSCRVVILTPQEFEKLKKIDAQLALKLMNNVLSSVVLRYEELAFGLSRDESTGFVR